MQQKLNNLSLSISISPTSDKPDTPDDILQYILTNPHKMCLLMLYNIIVDL